MTIRVFSFYLTSTEKSCVALFEHVVFSLLVSQLTKVIFSYFIRSQLKSLLFINGYSFLFTLLIASQL